MSFLKKLFGGGSSAPPPAATQEHKGFLITAHPAAEGSQHRVSGTIRQERPEGAREKRFDRSDRMASRDEAVELTFTKGRLIIDQLGERFFE